MALASWAGRRLFAVFGSTDLSSVPPATAAVFGLFCVASPQLPKMEFGALFQNFELNTGSSLADIYFCLGKISCSNTCQIDSGPTNLWVILGFLPIFDACLRASVRFLPWWFQLSQHTFQSLF